MLPNLRIPKSGEVWHNIIQNAFSWSRQCKTSYDEDEYDDIGKGGGEVDNLQKQERKHADIYLPSNPPPHSSLPFSLNAYICTWIYQCTYMVIDRGGITVFNGFVLGSLLTDNFPEAVNIEQSQKIWTTASHECTLVWPKLKLGKWNHGYVLWVIPYLSSWAYAFNAAKPHNDPSGKQGQYEFPLKTPKFRDTGCELKHSASETGNVWDIRVTSLAGVNLGMRPADQRRRYNVTTSLIRWART